MGIFSKRLKQSPKEQWQQPASRSALDREGMYTFQYGTDTFYIYNIHTVSQATYPDGSSKNIVMAQIAKAGKKGTTDYTNGDIIGFELNPDQEYTDALCQSIMSAYFYYKQEGRYENSNSLYLGIFQEKPTGEVIYYEGYPNIQQYIEVQAQETRRQVEAREAESKALSNASNEAFYTNKAAMDQEQFEEALAAKQAHLKYQIQHPEFCYSYPARENELENYDGTDINTGEWLRLRGVKKVGKNNGTYLYTGYLSHATNITDVEVLKNSKEGLPIAFETTIRLEDIANLQDSQAIKNILELLSFLQKDLQFNTLNYIGKLDNNTSQITREKFPQNPGISEAFFRLKREFEDEYLRNNQTGR